MKYRSGQQWEKKLLLLLLNGIKANVIKEISDWIFNLAEKYYLPVLEKEGLVAAE